MPAQGGHLKYATRWLNGQAGPLQSSTNRFDSGPRLMCLGGEIGKRDGLENQCPDKLAGSNPVRDTITMLEQMTESSDKSQLDLCSKACQYGQPLLICWASLN